MKLVLCPSLFLPARLTRPFSTSRVLLSGHNKWSKIKQKKGINDAHKGAVYGRASRDILVAVRNGGSIDPELNVTLAAVLKKAKTQGVPKENIESALKKAAGGKDKGGDQHLTFEALAVGSVGVMIECLTNNLNRTLTNVRDIVTSHGAQAAAVAYLFDRRGSVRVALDKGEDLDARMEQLVDAALAADAEDFNEVSATEEMVELEFVCPPQALAKVTTAVTSNGLCKELLNSELMYTPKEPAVEEPDEATAEKVSELVTALEEDEDVIRVWTTL